MTTPPTITAVIFDMDGLMIDTETISKWAWFKTMAEFNLNLTDEVYIQAVGRTGPDTITLFEEAMQISLPAAVYERKTAYYNQYIAKHGLATQPGLLELLNLIDSLGLAKAVASSSNRAVIHEKLTMVDLLDRFPIRVGGDEIEHGKPAPDIFLRAAALLAHPPAHCVVLEDSEPGIRAAHAADMWPLMVPDLKQPTAEIRQLAHAVHPSLHEVSAYLRRTVNATP